MIKKLFVASFLFLLHMDLYAQIPNAGFENIYIRSLPPHDTLPTSWTTIYGAGSSTNAYSGKYALSTWNWYGYAAGWAALGNVPATNFQFEKAYVGGIPYTSKPHHFYGKYLFDTTGTGNRQGVDSAAVLVIAKKYNFTLQKIDTVAIGLQKLGPANSYRTFEVEIEDKMPGVLPDSMTISFFNCLGCICNMAAGFNTCLYFTVDELSFDVPLTTQETTSAHSGPNIWPNPAHDFIRIGQAGNVTRVELYNVFGSIVAGVNPAGKQELTIPVSGLSSGTYFLRTITNGKAESSRHKILVIH